MSVFVCQPLRMWQAGNGLPQTPKGHRDSRFSGARGCSPLVRSRATQAPGQRILSAVRGGSAGRTIHGRQTMYRSAPLVPKGFCRFRQTCPFPGTLGKILRAVNHNRPEALFTPMLAFPAQFVVSDTVAVI